MHQVLQKFHRAGGTSDAQEMIEELNAGWITAGYESAAHEAQHLVRATEIVNQYHLSHQERLSEQVETTMVEKTISCDMGRFNLSGRVDRIDQYPDGNLEIIDYKSGRLSVEPEEVAASLAMNCYQLILSRIYPGVPVRGTIYCLQTGVQASYELSGDNLTKFASDITEIGNTILDFDWEAARPAKIEHCEECEFLARCQTYWRQMERNRDRADSFSDSGL